MITAIRFFLSAASLVLFLVLPGFFAWSQYKAYAYQNLVNECKEKVVRVERGGRVLFEPIVCDRWKIYEIDFPNRHEIQNKVYYAKDGENWYEPFLAVAGVILTIAAIPLLWQIILRMISDISKAIRGQL